MGCCCKTLTETKRDARVCTERHAADGQEKTCLTHKVEVQHITLAQKLQMICLRYANMTSSFLDPEFKFLSFRPGTESHSLREKFFEVL